MNITKVMYLIIFSFLLFSFEGDFEIITNKLVEKHLFTLSSDEMQGRKSGAPGIEKAASYIESEFERIGLATFKEGNSYRQNFTKKELDLFNVIGVLEGKSKKDEFVVISAHYDHLGIDNTLVGDSIYNGANDNASGVTAMLVLAEYFKNKDINERSILFVAFTAEELGLLGSNFFGTQIIPEQIIAGINIEMIGKESSFGPNTAWLTGFERSDFGKIIQKNLQGSDYNVYPDPYLNFRLFFRSDNASLARLGVPAHTFSTTQVDIDKEYHKVSDEIESLNIETITKTIKAISVGITSIVDGTDRPTRIKLIEEKKKKGKEEQRD